MLSIKYLQKSYCINSYLINIQEIYLSLFGFSHNRNIKFLCRVLFEHAGVILWKGSLQDGSNSSPFFLYFLYYITRFLNILDSLSCKVNFSNNLMKKPEIIQQVKVLALHTANLWLTVATHVVYWAQLWVIPEYRNKNKKWSSK